MQFDRLNALYVNWGQRLGLGNGWVSNPRWAYYINAETVVVNDASGDNNNNLWRIRLIKEWVNGDSISFLCEGLPDTLAREWYTIATNRKKKKERSKVTVKLSPNRNASERTLIITIDASGFMDTSFKIKQAGAGN